MGSNPTFPIALYKKTGYEDAVRDVRNSRLVSCRYKYAENSHISQDREVESHKAHILGNGGSNPSPAISNMINSVQIDFQSS